MESIGDYVYSTKYIGRGSFSFVYKGHHHKTNQTVAIKKMELDSVDDNLRNHIRSEIKLMKKLRHPNIVILIDVLHDNKGSVYLIMEYCPGGDLATFLNRKPLKEKYAKKYIQQIANAMEYLVSRNIMHRDLKPQNIMLHDPNTIKLTDFGFAKVFDSDHDQMTNTICGSPIYMAPEIIKCNNYSMKTDLWSIGIILYEMIVGQPPYKARNHYELVQKIETSTIYIPKSIEVSNDCKDLIYKLLQKEPDKRISWNEFFQHFWITGDIVLNSLRKNYENELDELLDSLDLTLPSSDDEKKKSKPIPIKKKENDGTEGETISSPMFNNSIPFSPNEDNGFVLVEPPKDYNNNDTERIYSESLLGYMKNTLNYLKSYYWWK